MANASQNVTISTADNTSVLDLFVNDQLITQYSYDNDIVTLSGNAGSIVVTLEDFLDNVEFIRIWIRQIAHILDPELSVISLSFESELKKTATTVQAFYEREEAITDSTYTPSTETATFLPRSETVLSFKDFKIWYSFLRRYAITCKEF